MTVGLWTAGTLITSLLWAGVVTLLLYYHLKYQSLLSLPYMAVLSGGMLVLFTVSARVVFGNLTAYRIMVVPTITLVSFAIPNLVFILTDRASHRRFLPFFLALVLLIFITAFLGAYHRFPFIIAISGIMAGAVVFGAGLLLLFQRKKIQNPHLRQYAVPGAGFVMIVVPMELLRLYLWQRAVDPFGVSRPSFAILIYMLVLNMASLIVGIRKIVLNSHVVCENLDSEAVDEYRITPRECEIIQLINKGDSNEEIASRLFVSTSTVKNHIYHIYQKTGFHNRIEMLNALGVHTDSTAVGEIPGGGITNDN